MKCPNHPVAALAIAVALSTLPPTHARAQAPEAPEMDTAAISALNRMAEYLNVLQAFQVRADIVTDKVLVDGQKIQTISTADVVASRPDRMRLNLTDAQRERLFLYDGATFTLWAPRLRYYSQMSAPSNLASLADTLEARYDIELPLVDLFRWGTPQSDLRNLTSAVDIGPGQVEGVTVEQYAFRQEGLDWQIWIQQGEYPLPRKLVLTTTTDEARPQHSVTYTWNLAPSYNDGTFVFVAPEDARKIPIATVTASAEADSR